MRKFTFRIYTNGNHLKDMIYPEGFLLHQGINPDDVRDLVRIEKFITEGVRKEVNNIDDVTVEYLGVTTE